MILEKQTIRLRQMEFYAQHGVLPQERVVGGRYMVDVALDVRLDEAALLHDCLEGTVNYAEVYEVCHVYSRKALCYYSLYAEIKRNESGMLARRALSVVCSAEDDSAALALCALGEACVANRKAEFG